MNAISYQSQSGFGFTLPIGTEVVNVRRRKAVGVVKSEPFLTTFPNGDRREMVWVDYSDARGIVAIDDVGELEVVGNHRADDS